MHTPIKRVFVVGCARSGTTLFQAMLSAHSDVLGFPETFFFAHSRPADATSSCWRRRRQAVYALQEAASRIGQARNLSWRANLKSPTQIEELFLTLLDGASQESGKRVWSEKTPAHIHSIKRISRAAPQAKFVHLLRDGRDVIASLEDIYRRRQDDKENPGVAWPLEESIHQWNRCIKISKSYADHPDHYLLSYSDLVSNPTAALCAVCEFLSIEYQPQMLEFQRTSEAVLGQDSQNDWRRDILGPLKETHLIKYQKLFNTSQKELIEGHLDNLGRVDIKEMASRLK